MRIRCLVIDKQSTIRDRVVEVLKMIPSLDVHCASTYRDSTSIFYSFQPNLIIMRCDEAPSKEERLFSMIGRLKWKCVLILLIAKPLPELIDSLMHQKHVVDILTDNTDPSRIHAALRKAYILLCGDSEHRPYFRGFLGFVGIIPSLRERKILSDAGIGLIQNRSLRLAIDYWRKNPDSQMIAVAFNAFETFTTRPDELIDCWDDFDLRPWEYGLYEAQRHYLEYWKVPIREGLLPITISSLIRDGGEDLVPLKQEEVHRILVKVGQMVRLGSLEEIFETMGIKLRTDSLISSTKNYDDFIANLDKKMKEVDKKYPELTRPPTETGYEDFIPDIATPYQEEASRMAFLQKKK